MSTVPFRHFTGCAALAVRAEEFGVDSVGVCDHIATPPQIASTYPSALPTDSFTPDNARNFWQASAVPSATSFSRGMCGPWSSGRDPHTATHPGGACRRVVQISTTPPPARA